MTAYALPASDKRMRYIVDGTPIPDQFPYLSVLLEGRPRHQTDDFSRRHPPMDRGKRAKLFAPFDALDGYSESIAGKDAAYTDRLCPDERDREEINRRLTILRGLTFNSRLARANRVRVAVTRYVPCTDEESFACGVRGRYETVVGTVRRVDPERGVLLVDASAIPFEDISVLAPETEGLFDREWET